MSILCEHNNETEDGWTVEEVRRGKNVKGKIYMTTFGKINMSKESILVKLKNRHTCLKELKEKAFEEFWWRKRDLQECENN